MKNTVKDSVNAENPSRKGLSIAFLGPDGSGKSTIISRLLKKSLPFDRNDYFHLRPVISHKEHGNTVVRHPHEKPPYGALKSYAKLLFLIVQYNMGWLKNILPLKRKSSLIIFDRYFDDLLVDHLRYRYGGSKKFARWLRNFIPRPELYFVLTAKASIIHSRKQEVPFAELERQIHEYEDLARNTNYWNINVDRDPEKIVQEIHAILVDHLNS